MPWFNSCHLQQPQRIYLQEEEDKKKNSVHFYGQNLHGQCLRLTSLSGFQKHADAHVQTMTPIIHQTAQSPLVSYQSETRSRRLVQQFAKDAWKK
jgi:hypothetical protein